MQRTFELDKVIVNLHYTRLPEKKDLESACINFFRMVQEQKQNQEDKNKKQ